MSYCTRDNPYPLLYVIRKSIFGLWLAALIWYMAACVAEDKKPKAAPTAALMLATWLLAMWAS